MPLNELPVEERTCSNCGSYSCQGLLAAFAGKQAKDCASWNESSASVRVRAEKCIAELEAARDEARALIRAARERLSLHQMDMTTVHSIATDDVIRALLAKGGA